jgi:hypothetical protein
MIKISERGHNEGTMLNLNRLAFGLFAIVGCGGNSVVHIQGSGDGGTGDDSGTTPDGGTQDRDGSLAGSDSSTANPDDGVASHMACVQTDGTAITGTYGRLDGFLRSVVLPNTGCGGDPDHVHLRVEANGKIYDFAVNIYSTKPPASDVFFLAKDAPLPSGAWAEGWHSSGVTLDYAGNLKVASGDFTQTPRAQLASTIDAALNTANHISVFATPYVGGTGGDKVHRTSGGGDGAVVINPTTSAPHFLLFHFSTQTF